MKERDYIKLEFTSRTTTPISVCENAMVAFTEQLKLTPNELGDIKTAISEAVANAINHAYPDKSGKILVRAATYDDNTLIMKVQDWGRGIANVKKARESFFTQSSDNNHSGMGFTIMESFMDTVTVKSTPGEGTTVTMSKKLGAK